MEKTKSLFTFSSSGWTNCATGWSPDASNAPSSLRILNSISSSSATPLVPIAAIAKSILKRASERILKRASTVTIPGYLRAPSLPQIRVNREICLLWVIPGLAPWSYRSYILNLKILKMDNFPRYVWKMSEMFIDHAAWIKLFKFARASKRYHHRAKIALLIKRIIFDTEEVKSKRLYR